jgi:predicted protein tyrosine phosphatase
MNDQFVILMYQAAQRAVENNPGKLNVISIIGGRSMLGGVKTELCRNCLVLRFEDLDTDIEHYKEYIYPQKHHIEEAIEFAKKHYIHLIHCGAGLSRSPAIGYAILRSEGYSKEDALKKILEKV